MPYAFPRQLPLSSLGLEFAIVCDRRHWGWFTYIGLIRGLRWGLKEDASDAHDLRANAVGVGKH